MPNRFITQLIIPLAFILAALTVTPIAAVAKNAPVYPCHIKAQYPHDPTASTQGLFYHNDQLYESSGGFGASFIAIVDLETGRHLRKHSIQGRLFAEGFAPHGGKLFLLTWLSGTGLILDPADLDSLGSFSYRRTNESVEGWGLTAANDQFIASSGTARLRFYRTDSFTPSGAVTVIDDGDPVRFLNELEYVNGLVLANIWKHDVIAAIDPATGQVRAWIDISPLRKLLGKNSGVANGIAYDAKNKRLFVTGKHWDKLFHIEVNKAVWEKVE